MKYAVEFFFDNDIESYIKGLWAGLKENDITPNMAIIEEIRPHITVAVYNSELPVKQFIEMFDATTNNFSRIDLNIDIIACFPPSASFPESVVFAAPTITSQLFETHRQYYKNLSPFNEFANKLYVPERWNPHCTLAIMLDKPTLMKTLEYCLSKFEPIVGKVTEIGLVKIDYGNGIHSSKSIFSKTLR